MMKKLTALVLTLALCLTAALAVAETDKTYTIGIAQFAEHSSLDNCREGFIQGLAEMGYVEGENVTFIVQNAQADMGLCQQIAQQMAQECDLVCAIATPMAQAAFNACMDSGKPVIYTAVSDPVAAMLANDEGKSEYNVTGTCDVLPVEAQLKLIRSFLPEAKKIGMKVVALVSKQFAGSTTSRHSSGKNLMEVADVVIDIKCVAGDAALEMEGLEPHFCGTSTVLGMSVMESIVAQTVENCVKAGYLPPIYVSSNLDKGDAINDEHIKKYSKLISCL